MLVQCPKCKFQQPQDQYCARCGVDMTTYKPEEKTQVEKTLESGTLKFVIIVFIGFIVIQSFLRSEVSYKWMQRINRFGSVATQEPNTEGTHKVNKANLDHENQNENAKALSTPTAAVAVSKTAAVSSATALAHTDTASNTAKLSDLKEIKYNIYAYEVDKSDFDQALNNVNPESFIVNDQDQLVFTSSNFNDLKKNMKMKELLQKVVNIKENTQQKIWVGHNNRETPVGIELSFFHKVRPINPGFDRDPQMQNNLLHFVEFEISKKTPNDNLVLPFAIYAPQLNDTIVIANSKLLAYFELEPELQDIPLFQATKTENYRNQFSSIIFVIQKQ